MATYHPQCILLALLVCAAFSPALGDTTSRFTRSETLSDYFSLTWEVDLEARNITFEVKAKTTGYVGFGLNSKGGMKGADIVIGGVFANGTSYFSVSLAATFSRLFKFKAVRIRSIVNRRTGTA